MPSSTIKESEWNEILAIMEYKLGNKTFQRRFEGVAITFNEEFGFQ